MVGTDVSMMQKRHLRKFITISGDQNFPPKIRNKVGYALSPLQLSTVVEILHIAVAQEKEIDFQIRKEKEKLPICK